MDGAELVRRIGLAIGFATLAGGLALAIAIENFANEDAVIPAAIGGALVGFFITPFRKSRSEKKEVEKD